MSDKNLVVFVDNIGRTIVGEDVGSDDATWTVKNPSIVHVQPNPLTGQMTVQLIPFFFKEFSNNGDDTEWTFSKSNLVTSNTVLDSRLVEQYNRVNSAIVTPEQPQLVTPGGAPGGPTVKLFDD